MVCGLGEVRFGDSCHNRVKYSPINTYPGSVGKSGSNLKWVMIALIISCATLMVFITYMVETRRNSGSQKKLPGAGQGKNDSLNDGNIDAALNLPSTTRGSTTPQETTESTKTPDIYNLSRESVIKLMDKIVEKIRGGHGHKEALQVQLLLLQDRLKRIDEAAAKRKKMMKGKDDADDEEEKEMLNDEDSDDNNAEDGADAGNGGDSDDDAGTKETKEEEDVNRNEGIDLDVTSTEEVREEEYVRKQGPRTNDNPEVQRMIDLLQTSPSTLDRYDYSTPLTWDFPCFPKYLVGNRPTQVCVDNSAYDREFLEAITEEGTKEYKMLSVFTEYLETKFTLQVIDLGSNIGVFSLAAAALGRKVLAVEPCLKYILPFHKSVLQNHFQNQITFITNALSDEYKLIQLINDPQGDPRKTRTVDVTDSLLNNDVIDPRSLARSVKLSDLEPVVKYPEAIMKIDLNGDEARVFKESHHLLDAGLVSSVLMEWRYEDNPQDYDYIIGYFRSKGFVPRLSVHGPRVTYVGLRKYQHLILWIKEA